MCYIPEKIYEIQERVLKPRPKVRDSCKTCLCTPSVVLDVRDGKVQRAKWTHWQKTKEIANKCSGRTETKEQGDK